MSNNQLTAAMFRSITAGLNQKRDPAQEKRTQIRVGFRARIMLHPYTDGLLEKPVSAWCRDVSEKGIGVMCDTDFKAGRQFILALSGEEQPVYLVYSVAQCAKKGEGAYTIGARLLEEMSPLVFNALKRTPPATPARPPAARVVAQASPASLIPAPNLMASPAPIARVALPAALPWPLRHTTTAASPDSASAAGGRTKEESEVQRIRDAMLSPSRPASPAPSPVLVSAEGGRTKEESEMMRIRDAMLGAG